MPAEAAIFGPETGAEAGVTYSHPHRLVGAS